MDKDEIELDNLNVENLTDASNKINLEVIEPFLNETAKADRNLSIKQTVKYKENNVKTAMCDAFTGACTRVFSKPFSLISVN